MKNKQINNQIQNQENIRTMLRYFDNLINVETNPIRKDYFREIRKKYENLLMTSNQKAIMLDNMIGSVIQLYSDYIAFDDSEEGRASDNQRFEIIQDWLNRFIERRKRIIDRNSFVVNRKDARRKKWKEKINQKYEMKFWGLDTDAYEMKLREAEMQYQNTKNQKEKNELLEQIYENQNDQNLRIKVSRINGKIESNNRRIWNNSVKITKAEELKSVIEENMDEEKDKNTVVNEKGYKKAYKKRYKDFTKQSAIYDKMDLYKDAYVNEVNNNMGMNSYKDTDEEIQAYINKRNEQQRNQLINDSNLDTNYKFKNRKEGE